MAATFYYEHANGVMSVQVSVSDLDTTEAFYAGLLGVMLKRTVLFPGFPERLTLETDDFSLVFIEDSAVIGAQPILQQQLYSFPRGVGVSFRFEVQGIEEIYQGLLDEGISMVAHLEAKPYGVKEVLCLDPDGYLVVLFEPSG